MQIDSGDFKQSRIAFDRKRRRAESWASKRRPVTGPHRSHYGIGLQCQPVARVWAVVMAPSCNGPAQFEIVVDIATDFRSIGYEGFALDIEKGRQGMECDVTPVTDLAVDHLAALQLWNPLVGSPFSSDKSAKSRTGLNLLSRLQGAADVSTKNHEQQH